MADNNGTLSAVGDSALLVLTGSGRADNVATFQVQDGTFAGLTLQCYTSDGGGNDFVLVAPYNRSSQTYESQSEDEGFAVPDNTGRKWDVYCANAVSVKFVVKTLSSGSVSWRADSSYQVGPGPSGPPTIYDPESASSGPAAAATSDEIEATAVPVVAAGLWTGQAFARQQQVDEGAASVADRAGRDYQRLCYVELWRIRKTIEATIGPDALNLDNEFPDEA